MTSLKNFCRFEISFILFLFILTPFSFAEDSDALATLKDPLRSSEERTKAITSLLFSQSTEFQTALFDILRNPREPIAFKREVESALVQVGGNEVKEKLEDLLSNRNEDLYVRQTCISILWQIIQDESEKQIFFSRLFRIVHDSSEAADVRSFALGHLNKAAYLPSQNPDWAKKIMVNKNEPPQLRASAITFVEKNQNEAFTALLSQIITNKLDDEEMRQVAILKAVLHDSFTFMDILKARVADQKENMTIRDVSLRALESVGGLDAVFLGQIIPLERNEEMRQKLEALATSLAG